MVTSTYLLFLQRCLSMSQYHFKMFSNLFPTEFSISGVVYFRRIAKSYPNHKCITNMIFFLYCYKKHVSLGFYLRPLLLIRFNNNCFLNIVFLTISMYFITHTHLIFYTLYFFVKHISLVFLLETFIIHTILY